MFRQHEQGPMVELRTLAYFVATCRAGSLALAADELGIAVSTLSTTMKTLEQDLGLELFRRISNGLYPTEAARTLMRAADPLLMAEYSRAGGSRRHRRRRSKCSRSISA
jgi:LysR family nitrogen assimilation transcriptional regulator